MYERIYDFQNLYKAHKRARLGKRNTREVIEFELNLSENLTRLSDSLREHSYRVSGYYTFNVYDPKLRKIHALHYRDRVVQHAICDEVLTPTLEPKLIYDNAACRIGKGTSFAIRRVSAFMNEFYKQHGTSGYFLKCDVRKFFENIDHEILKAKLKHVFANEPEILDLLCVIIDSYESKPGKGLPLGNQTSQWFANYYLDEFDRVIKEKLRLKYYSRYMDDCVIIHVDKEYLRYCLEEITKSLTRHALDFNEKTVIFPLKNGVNYLGWHFYITSTGKIIRRVTHRTKFRFKRRLSLMQKQYKQDAITFAEIKLVLSAYYAHLIQGHTYKLMEKTLEEFTLTKSNDEEI